MIQPGTSNNYSRSFAVHQLEMEREMAEERRKIAQRKRRQALLETRTEEYSGTYF